MRSLNRVTLIGQLLKGEARIVGGGKMVCNFEVKTVETWMGKNGEQTREVVHDCVAFGPVATEVKRVAVGGHIYLEGALRRGDVNVVDGPIEIVCFVVIPMVEQQEAA